MPDTACFCDIMVSPINSSRYFLVSSMFSSCTKPYKVWRWLIRSCPSALTAVYSSSRVLRYDSCSRYSFSLRDRVNNLLIINTIITNTAIIKILLNTPAVSKDMPLKNLYGDTYIKLMFSIN